MSKTIYFRQPSAKVVHLTSTSSVWTNCEINTQEVSGARFRVSDLPSGERNFKVCEKCREAKNAARRPASYDYMISLEA